MNSTEPQKYDARLTYQQQMAVIGHCMRDPSFWNRNDRKLRPDHLDGKSVSKNYFDDAVLGAIYDYLSEAVAVTGKNTSIEELQSIIHNKQADLQTIKVYSQRAADSYQMSTNFTQALLAPAIANQEEFYKYREKLIKLGQYAEAGNREKVFEAAESFVKLRDSGYKTAPTLDENLATLEKEERWWEEVAFKNRVPFLNINLNQHFMLTPGISLIGGTTKAGKSTLLANLAPPILDWRRDKKIFVISNEDNLDLVSTRIACVSTGVSIRKYRFERDTLAPGAVEAIKAVKRDLASRIVIASRPAHDTSIIEVCQDLLMEAKISDEYSAIMMDYYQIGQISREFPKANYVEVYKKQGTWLKGYAADLPIPMLLFAQLNPTSDKQEIPFQQRVQGDHTIANHVHVGLEIVRTTDDVGPMTDVVCHFSRHGDVQGRIASFRFRDGQLILAPRK